MANNHYIRQGASGAADGSDWTNAWTNMPSTMIRGDTYYVADGTYAGVWTLNDVVDGTSYIYVKKATVDSHGTDTGWSDSYGDGQATIEVSSGNNFINITTSYWDIDGQSGSGSDSSSYGFTFNHTNPGVATAIYEISMAANNNTHLIIKHCAFVCPGSSYDVVQVGIYHAASSGTSDNEIAYNYFSNGSAHLQLRRWSDSSIHDNYFYDNWSSASNHGQHISPGESSNDVSLYNNIFKDSATFVVSMHKNTNYRWKIYNNIVIGGVLTAVFANGDSSTANVFMQSECHHNTFYDVTCGGRGAFFVGTITDVDNDKSYAYNNLFVNCSDPQLDNADGSAGAIVHTHNAHFDSTGTYDADESGTAQDDTGDPFVGSGEDNFHLSGATDAGTTLSSPFTTDLDGNTRGLDGVWDRGAYEYAGASGFHGNRMRIF